MAGEACKKEIYKEKWAVVAFQQQKVGIIGILNSYKKVLGQRILLHITFFFEKCSDE